MGVVVHQLAILSKFFAKICWKSKLNEHKETELSRNKVKEISLQPKLILLLAQDYL